MFRKWQEVLCTCRYLHLPRTNQCVPKDSLKYVHNRFISQTIPNYFCKEIHKNENKMQFENANIRSSLGSKHKIFRDQDSSPVFDVNEETEKILLEELESLEQLDPYEGIDLKHGVNGVFEIDTLIELLKREHARNIFVATVPKEFSYVDYIVVVSCKTYRQMEAVTAYVRKAFKLVRHKNDIIPKVEGKNSKDWMAMDLGNIALHIFSNEARLKYDLETLWSVGSRHDDLTNVKDDQFEIFDRYNEFLRKLEPAE